MSTLKDYTFGPFNLVEDVFIETGTELGETLSHAARAGFAELHSVELSPEVFELAKKRFASFPNVKLYCGSSPHFLKQVIDRDRATTFWLDAHFQGLHEQRGEVAEPEFGECPLLAELDVIFSAPWKKLPIVIIDDEYMFNDTPERLNHYCRGRKFDFAQWPLTNHIKRKFPANYEFHVFDYKIYCIPK